VHHPEKHPQRKSWLYAYEKRAPANWYRAPQISPSVPSFTNATHIDGVCDVDDDDNDDDDDA